MELIATETLVIELLLIVSLVAIVVRRLRIPYTVALVIVGLILTFEESLKVTLTPDLILALFVPPLIFEAAFHIEFDRLRENLVSILVLAVPGVLLTMLVVGLIVSVGINRPLEIGLVFGALIAATDPVAVVALFRALGAPKQLALLVEGESLFNDGTAIVVFRLVLAAAGIATVHAAEGAAPADFNLIASVIDFFVVSIGGLTVGGLLGWIVSRLIFGLDDYLIEITLTTVLAFGAYLAAEALSVSGVLAVVAAGMINGNIGPKGMSPTTRIVLFNFWEYVAFVANSLVFLLIGLEVKIFELTTNLNSIIVAIVAVIVSRALSVYVLGALVSLRGRKTPTVYRHVQFWGGLRGAISLALVLSLPPEMGDDRSLLLSMTFGVVLFTLVVQGTTMQFLMSRLGLVRRDEDELEYERRHARLVAARAASDHLDEMRRGGLVSTATWAQLKPALDERIETYLEAQNALLREKPELQREEIDDARREGLRAERAALSEMLRDGLISEPVFEELVVEIDAALDRPLHEEQLETDSDAASQPAA